ncbi:MAG: RDD family protein [Planctomycetota bacterium]
MRRHERLFMREEDPSAARLLTTPEGMEVRFHVAALPERLIAFLIDMIAVGLILIVLVTGVGFVGFFFPVAGAFILLLVFLVWNFYFVWFEGRRQGLTSGKRAMRLRVIDRRGGPLTMEAVLARNLARNVEVLLPLIIFAQRESLTQTMPGWAGLLSLVWVILFCLLPLLNPDHLRVGDMIAGTMVVSSPRKPLLIDVARQTRKAGDEPLYTFSARQMEIYGIYELQVLEQLLRERTPDQIRKLRAVGQTIRGKIGWDADEAEIDERRFLTEFYQAQRRHHEHRLTLGKRQEFKRR